MPTDPFRILLAEDDAPSREFMRKLLAADGYEIVEACDGESAFDLLGRERVDLVVSDIMMPGGNGLDLCRRIRASEAHRLLPVILVTARNQERDRVEGLDAGADDFLGKPVNAAELKARIRNFRRVVGLQNQVQRARLDAEALVEERTEQLRNTIERLRVAQAEAAIAQLDVIQRLAAATEYKDADTGSHIQRIAESTHVLAEALGWFDESRGLIVGQASTMHDLGKIGIPDYILTKPGLLTPEEFELMKRHTILGWRLLRGSSTALLQAAATIARSHHEKWDGSGYPDGLAGEEIPREARIVAVADVFDALRSQRCYKPEFPLEQCYGMIRERAGSHFDPEVVEAFMDSRGALGAIRVGLDGDGSEPLPASDIEL
jgi:putative two-component system response regulator